MPDMSVADLHTASCDIKIKRQRHLLRFKPGLREVLFSPVELLCSAAGRSAALRGCTTPLVFRWWWLRSPCNKRPKMLTSFNLVNLTCTVTKWFSSGAKIHRASQNESGWISKVTRLQLALFLFYLFSFPTFARISGSRSLLESVGRVSLSLAIKASKPNRGDSIMTGSHRDSLLTPGFYGL